MAKISFIKKMAPITVENGSNLLTALLNAGIPVASSCYGDGVCAKCRLEIIQGMENLSEEKEIETFLKQKNKMEKSQRIACQVKLSGDIVVDATYW